MRKLVDTPLCPLCNQAEETISHMLWQCVKIQDYWSDVLTWLTTNFAHCHGVQFSLELIICGVKINWYSDRILDSMILIAKYIIFLAKLQGREPTVTAFVNYVKNWFEAEKYQRIIDGRYVQFVTEWKQYSHFFH